MKPLCKKIYFRKIVEIVALLLFILMDTMFVIHMGNDYSWLVIIIPISVLLIVMTIDSIYWIFQPHVLIYQYESGIVIHRKMEIEYTSIEKCYYKKYIDYKSRGSGGVYTEYDPWSGIIFIELKSGKIYKIRNACFPIEVVDTLTRIKKQKKFR